eukprot:gene127-biopygen10582
MLRVLQEKLLRVRNELDKFPVAPTPPSTHTTELHTFDKVTAQCVIDALKKTNKTWSTDTEGVPMAVLRQILPGIAPQVADLTNTIMRTGVWPDQWKTATIRVIWKKRGSQQDPKVYRPISILPALSRIIERLVERQLRTYLEPYLPKEQHGFRAHHGCTTALATLVRIAANARAAQGRRKAVVIASLDAASAFDTVDHHKLLEKLEHSCGVKGTVLKLLKSYLYTENSE